MKKYKTQSVIKWDGSEKAIAKLKKKLPNSKISVVERDPTLLNIVTEYDFFLIPMGCYVHIMFVDGKLDEIWYDDF